jgi:eukaryotic-like serine/threonine-protein kinase
LVSDPAHRPDDLFALAQALHQFAPPGSVAPPPPADVSRLDHDSNFEVDLRMSMLPPEDLPPQMRAAAAMPPAGSRPGPRSAPRSGDATSELASLKARLEADPRPRYVVVKEGMDHGPFSAVELLQQIATHTFVDADILRDSLSNDERTIKDWDEFAPFAEHARLHRDIKAEKAAIDRVVVQESRSTRGKAIFGIAIVGALLVGGAVWFFTVRGSKKDDVALMDDTMSNIELDGGINASGKRGGGAGGKRVVGRGPGGVPILGGGS